MPLDELMLAACRNDQEDLLNEVISQGNCDPNFVDGAGNTAAHYAYGTSPQQNSQSLRSIDFLCSFYE